MTFVVNSQAGYCDRLVCTHTNPLEAYHADNALDSFSSCHAAYSTVYEDYFQGFIVTLMRPLHENMQCNLDETM